VAAGAPQKAAQLRGARETRHSCGVDVKANLTPRRAVELKERTLPFNDQC